MEGIQPYQPGSSRTPAHPTTTFAPAPTLTKAPSDYLRAVRRRVWLVLAVCVPFSVVASVFVVKLPAVYRAAAQVQIEPPEFDPILTTLVSRDYGKHDGRAAEIYVPNKLALLKSKALAEEVLSSSEFSQGGPGGEPTDEIVEHLQAREIPKSSSILVTLEGHDPARTAKLLFALLDRLREHARLEALRGTDDAKSNAEQNLNNLKNQLAELNKRIDKTLRESTIIGPDGKNLLEQQWIAASSVLMGRRSRLDDLRQQSWITQLVPGRDSPFASERNGKLAELERQKQALSLRLKRYKRTTRSFNSDPAVQRVASELEAVLDEMEAIKSAPLDKPDVPGSDALDALTRSMGEELRQSEAATGAILAKYKESAPAHQIFLNDLEERQQISERISELANKISDFDILRKSQKDAVVIPPSVAEPSVPVRPKRAMFIVMSVILSLGVGIGLDCLLEHLDHSIKVPEHLSTGLTLPLFGVVPRIRRTALTHRGGHLWTPGAPESVEADAYRNLRASLLGATDRIGPIVTLLVTSAKAGEGKSTTALNLAATCARAGERTLLMDVDLRRPSLVDVFNNEDHEAGLVDALRGNMPWQRTLVRTDVPNLDFMPTGNTRDVPIEILGTLELRQLIIAVSGHYDRVILDGPAVLGLADCRMLGRVVDAALLVVRSGAHGLAPLLRAKGMLEQSHVTIAGVVFNGLFEDLKNWSSYGPYEPYGGALGASRRLGSFSSQAAALPASS